MSIGEHLYNKRMHLGLQQEDVADIVKIITDTVTYWERGRAEPLVYQMPKIIAFLGYLP